MAKALQVVVVFEFAGIESPDSPEAEVLLDDVTFETERLTKGSWGVGLDMKANVWVDDVRVREGEEV